MKHELPVHAPAVVIGGGIMGCSTLYHLATLGVTDAVLVERNQLTSGTTWHSAAQVRQLRSTENLTRLIQYSAKLYAELEGLTGQATGWLRTGSVSIATNPDRLVHVRRQAALARAYGIEAHEIDAGEVKRLWPLINDADVLGGVWSPDDGRVNPSDLCLALVKGAKARGARVFEHTAVTGFHIDNGRIAGVQTTRGPIRCEKVALCGGLWSRALAAKADVSAPLLACEHFYLLTKPIDGIVGHLPSLSDHDGHLYIRDDVGGLLVGCFEPRGKALRPDALGESFAFGLLPEDWDHFEPMMHNALHRIPALQTAEVKTLLNGPESFTPDGSFMLGEIRTRPGLFLGCGMNSVGIATGGGAGWALSHWMVDGAAPYNLGEADPDRFHETENALEALLARAPEVLGKHYAIAYPGTQWQSARNLRLTPLDTCWRRRKARFGQVFGWERPLYFQAEGEPRLSFGQPVWFDQVGREVETAHHAAAVFDQSTFGKIHVRGDDAERYLNRLCTNDMTRPAGHVTYSAMLNERGGFESDLTAQRTTPTDYLLYVGTGAVHRDLAWLLQNRAPKEQVAIRDVTEDYAVLALMGANTPRIATSLGAEWMNDIGYFRHARGDIAGLAVRAARLSYVGEAGWEISCAAGDARALFECLHGAGASPAGLYAQTSMRIEKRFLAMGHDLDGDVSPLEAGLEFAVKRNADFVGRAALETRRKTGPRKRLVSILLADPETTLVGHEPVYSDARLIGQTTSAAYGYRIERPVALAYVATESLGGRKDPFGVQLDVAGTHCDGTASLTPAFDPSGTRMRP